LTLAAANASCALVLYGERSLEEQQKRSMTTEAFRDWLRDSCGFFVLLVHDIVSLLHLTVTEYLVVPKDFTYNKEKIR
jgi:hypothetical protein